MTSLWKQVQSWLHDRPNQRGDFPPSRYQSRSFRTPPWVGPNDLGLIHLSMRTSCYKVELSLRILQLHFHRKAKLNTCISLTLRPPLLNWFVNIIPSNLIGCFFIPFGSPHKVSTFATRQYVSILFFRYLREWKGENKNTI
jgi:hypothetical protein